MTTPSSTMRWHDSEPRTAGPVERAVEQAIARVYGLAYDGIVDAFAPYQSLLDDIEDLLARAEHGQSLRVLDIACGTGTVARRLARAGHVVTGLDPVVHLVERARRRPAARVTYEHGDVTSRRLPDGSFDACVSLHTLNWHPRPLAMLRECRRVLRPGGHAIIACYTASPTLCTTFGAVRASEGMGAAVAALRWLAPTAVFEACRHYDARYPDVSALHRELALAGFDTVESRPVFLAGVSRLVWARLGDCGAPDHDSSRREL